MMYKTHIKIGQSLYMLSIPLLSSANIMPSIATGNASDLGLSAVALGASALVGFHGASWGAGYPDIDHPTSTPAKKNPLINKIFQATGVTHRGKFTHSMDVVTLTFMLLLLGATFLLKGIGNFLPELLGQYFVGTGLVASIVKIWIISAYIGAMTHLLADSLTKQGVRVLFFLPQMKLVGTRTNIAVVSIVVLVLTGLLPNILKINTLAQSEKALTIITATVGMLVAFIFSGIIYDLINGKSKKSTPNLFLKLVLSVVFGLVIILVVLSSMTNLINVETFGLLSLIFNNMLILQLVKILAITGFVTSIIPGLDFFKTGDDSTWEKLVRNLFNMILPLTFIITPALIFLQLR